MLKKCFSILVAIILILGVCLSVNATELKTKNEITNDFKLSSHSSVNGKVQYGVNVKKGDEDMWILIEAVEYNLPSNLYDYKDDIRLRVRYSQDNYEVLDCKVVNFKTGEIIEDLSEENINKLFNIEYGKKITEKNWTDTIKLSELKENEIYKYTANSTIQFPKIENDIGENCIIYIKEKDDKTYEKKINMYKEIDGTSINVSFNEYNSGDAFSIMYKKIGNEELVKLIEEDEIIFLSKYKDGDKLEYQFEKYIYNDTDKDITIHTKDMAFEVEKSDSVIIEKGKIYGFSWMIDSATISFATDVKNEEENNGNKVDSPAEVENKIDVDKLPETGEKKNMYLNVIYIIIGIYCISLIAMLYKEKKTK